MILIFYIKFSYVLRIISIRDKSSETSKHQGQHGLVERSWRNIVQMANSILLHTRLCKKLFEYTGKYAQRALDIIPERDLYDKDGLPTTQY